MEAVREFFEGLEKTRAPVRVSVIGYDDISEVTFEKEKPTASLVDAIKHTGYGTDFALPLEDAYNLASKS